MPVRRLLALMAIAGTLALSACSSEPPGPTPIVRALRTFATDGACAGVGLAAVIRGSPDDPAVAWIQTIGPESHRFEAVWPLGFHAVFDPTMTIVDGAGRPQTQDGDFINGGCVTGLDPESAPLLLLAPYPGYRLECGPIDGVECSILVSVASRAASWPKAPVAVVRFLTESGDFQVLLEDGRLFAGHATENGSGPLVAA